MELSYRFMKWSEVAQSCPTLCDPVDCGLPGSSIHGILQARILECVAISFSRGSSRPRDRTRVFHIAGRRFNLWATREAKKKHLLAQGPTAGPHLPQRGGGGFCPRALAVTTVATAHSGGAAAWGSGTIDL